MAVSLKPSERKINRVFFFFVHLMKPVVTLTIAVSKCTEGIAYIQLPLSYPALYIVAPKSIRTLIIFVEIGLYPLIKINISEE